jgi:hypothetical protein
MTEQEKRRIEYLTEELKKEKKLSTRYFKQVEELKKECKRLFDKYIGEIE